MTESVHIYGRKFSSSLESEDDGPLHWVCASQSSARGGDYGFATIFVTPANVADVLEFARHLTNAAESVVRANALVDVTRIDDVREIRTEPEAPDLGSM